MLAFGQTESIHQMVFEFESLPYFVDGGFCQGNMNVNDSATVSSVELTVQ
jgi:hypothetical protein